MKGRTLQTFSIRTKLLVFVTSLVVIPGAIYGVLAVSRSRAALAHTVGQQLLGEARNAADRLATALRAQRDNLGAAARQDVMREIRVGDLDKRISSFLTSLKGGCPTCRDFFAVDRGDRIVAASNPALIGLPFDGERGTLPDAAIEGPIEAPDGGATLTFSVTIPDPEAPRSGLGRLVGLVDWDRESAIMTRVRENLGTSGIDADVLVLDEAGVVVGGATRANGRWRRGVAIDFGTRHGAGTVAAARIEDQAGALVGLASLPDDLPRWTILVAQPLAEAFAPVRHMARLLGGVLVATLLAALGVALAAVRRITRPLAELTEAASVVGRGGGTPTPTVTVRSGDEIGTLATAFNRMGADLHRAERRLVEAAKFAFVGELAAGVAHEVRTPLGVLRSSAQLLQRALPAQDDEARELLTLVRDEVDRIEHVVSGLLELGRPRELRVEAARLGQIVLRAADFVEIQAREKGVGLRRRTIEPDPVVSCDPDLVYQVALNLLVNAVQILPPGGTIELALIPPHDGYAGFEVRDDGPGIPEDLRATIFQPFATRRVGGIGLGLTFVQRVVLEHHGRLAVSDAAGRGTVFRVELPTAESET